MHDHSAGARVSSLQCFSRGKVQTASNQGTTVNKANRWQGIHFQRGFELPALLLRFFLRNALSYNTGVLEEEVPNYYI